MISQSIFRPVLYLPSPQKASVAVRCCPILFELREQNGMCWFSCFAGMMQWREHSPLTSVARVPLLSGTIYVGWVCCWFSSFLWEVFLQVLKFSPLLKNQQLFQFPSWSGLLSNTLSWASGSEPVFTLLNFSALLDTWELDNSDQKNLNFFFTFVVIFKHLEFKAYICTK